MAYDNNAFCWHGINSTDTAKVIGFYPEVINWKTQEVEMGGEPTTLFAAGGVPRAHAAEAQGTPSHWRSYLRVEDVDASAEAAATNGGQVLVPPTDIPPGRFSIVTSPSGAAFSLFHEADPSAENAPSGLGSIHWTELHSKDIDADLAWLRGTFGFATKEMPMPDGPYYILESDGQQRGGAMQSQNEQAPSMWLSWVEVDDVDATATRAEGHGGQVHAPAFDVPNIGRMAILADNTGGVFGVITPAQR